MLRLRSLVGIGHLLELIQGYLLRTMLRVQLFEVTVGPLPAQIWNVVSASVKACHYRFVSRLAMIAGNVDVELIA